MKTKINIPEYNVSQFNNLLRDVVESNFNYLRIRGEISEIKQGTKKQLYLTLKDDSSILKCVMWENKQVDLPINLETGLEIVATGRITTWSRYTTTYQLDIDEIELAGEGALLKLIEDRKKKLKEKGYFDSQYKKSLPYLPNKIGVITSPTGSVIHDIIKRLRDRFPVDIDIWPVPVQGNESANSIINAIKCFNDVQYLNKPEVLIIARGGGSTEDLMSFNDEKLAVEVFKSKIPIISAIGHETDTTIIDYVSDLRASTPTAAAEIVVPSKTDLVTKIDNFWDRLNYIIDNSTKNRNYQLSNIFRLLKEPKIILEVHRDKLNSLFSFLNKDIDKLLNVQKIKINNFDKIIKSPDRLIEIKKNNLIVIFKNLERNIKEKQFYNKNLLKNLSRLVNSNSIINNLKKGYSIISKSKKLVKNSNQLKDNEKYSIQFYKETIEAKIKKIN